MINLLVLFGKLNIKIVSSSSITDVLHLNCTVSVFDLGHSNLCNKSAAGQEN